MFYVLIVTEIFEILVLLVDYIAMKSIKDMIGVDVVLAFFMITLIGKYHNYFANNSWSPPELLIRLLFDGVIVVVYYLLSIKKYKKVYKH